MAGSPAIIEAISQSLRYLSKRQNVVAQNIANADTPGYKARELAAQSFAGLIEGGDGGPMAVKAPQVQLSDGMKAMGAHLSVTSGTINDPNISETKPDGNTITLEDQLLKMGQIQADFAALTGLYRKQMNLVKSALGKGSSA